MTCTLHVAWDGRLAGYDFGPGTLVGTNTQTGPQSWPGGPSALGEPGGSADPDLACSTSPDTAAYARHRERHRQ